MVDRTCASCGALVGALVDVCPRCGGDPDLRLLELGAARRRGPERSERPGRPGIGWKRWTPIVAVVVVLWGFLALTSGGGDDDDEEAEAPAPSSTEEPKREPTTSTTRRPRPPRTTTTTIPFTDRAPLLGAETGLTLFYNDGRSNLLDLDTGIQRSLSLSDTIYGAVDGRLLVGQNGRLSWWPAPYDGTGAVPLGVPGPSDAWIGVDGSVIWVGTSTGIGDFDVRAIEPDGTVLTERSIPISSYPAGVMGDRLVLSAPGGTFAVAPDGDVELLSTGQLMAVGFDRVVVSRCDEQLDCRYEVVDEDGDARDVGNADQSAYYGPYGPAIVVSSRGQVAQGNVDAASGLGNLTIDGVAVDWEVPRDGASSMGWSSDGRWLAVGAATGDVVVIDAENLSVVTEIESTRRDAGTWRVMFFEGIDLQP